MIAAEGSFLADFYSQTAVMTPEERGRFLEDPPQDAPDIDSAHEVTCPGSTFLAGCGNSLSLSAGCRTASAVNETSAPG